jgi:hypothetical protein
MRSELADFTIYLVLLADLFSVDLIEAARAKLSNSSIPSKMLVPHQGPVRSLWVKIRSPAPFGAHNA